jgi:sec-independent protein translocase protein TatB
MFFDIGWPELMLIGVVALVVIGPKDLPAALRVAGYWVRKARTMSREFQSSVEQMLREAELEDVRQELKKVTEINLDHEVNKIMDPALDPAAGPAQTVPKPPDVPDYLDYTPAPADPLPPAVEPEALAPAPAEPAEPEPATAPEAAAVPEPAVPEPPPAEEQPARAAEPSKS